MHLWLPKLKKQYNIDYSYLKLGELIGGHSVLSSHTDVDMSEEWGSWFNIGIFA